MGKYCILYNSKTHNKKSLENARKAERWLPGSEFEYRDATEIGSLCDFLDRLPADTDLIFTGGDGTVNHVINELDGYELKRPLYYYPAGTGNDFINDLQKPLDCEPFPINEYMKHLPTVTVNGKRYKFINAVGFGLDGYCCEEKDRLVAMGRDKSYTMIAAEGLMFKYKPTNAKATVDGETLTFSNVWLAPTAVGSFYGGGVKIAPTQRRDDPEHLVTCEILHSCGRLRGATIFLDVCAGKAEKYPQYINIRRGRHVEVEFDRPVALQIDGETVLGVTRYAVDAAT
ncbi:MAG: diacylglycerol kinase family protein [Lachnospiraceae bacterium]|nr:diacylglycerol kinase family protein [Lachnospiraceae bacterium]